MSNELTQEQAQVQPPFNQKKIEELLEEYQKQIRMPQMAKIEPPDCITISLDDLRKKTMEELDEYVFALAQYSFYIQRVINKQNAWRKYLYMKLDEAASDYLPEIDSRHWGQEKMLIAKNRPEICKKLQAFLRQISMELELLNDVPNQIKFISDSIRDIRFSILRREKSNA